VDAGDRAIGMTFYSGEAFPDWQGDLFVGGLAATTLVRLEVEGREVTHEERMLEDLGLRIRDVEEGPGGALFLLTDEDDGEILRISPRRRATRGDGVGAISRAGRSRRRSSSWRRGSG
jgi:glucose/arabinose dehydrogenase